MSAIRGIDELMTRLERVEIETGVKQKEGQQPEQPQIKDDFLRLRAIMYDNLGETLEAIKERHNIQKRKGNCVEAVQKGAFVKEQLKKLDLDFVKLHDIYRKQSTQKRKFSEEEMKKRFEDMQDLKRRIEEAKMTFRNAGGVKSQDLKTITEMRRQMNLEAGNTGKGAGAGVRREAEEVTEEDKKTMQRWKERDEDFDRQLGLIGEGADRIKEVGQRIGDLADQQNAAVTELHGDADQAQGEINELNIKIKKVMDSQKNTTFFCRIILIVVLIALLGFLFTRLKPFLGI
uniref:t-SNARE coiled-coil homology domain-containing protein n=1 Tax=Chromera velia CCMP2878 TaxID=1169474 RepID=A0A0G4I743_9ALVE|mmetsp:Transcript_2393/g.5046  ORF Transcript_2393/g.5046 Transcript_2393/m.5046 type:complete len:289 (-) Transcript_2393:94-960(-)|eukprot:Cvel_11557.t1-p1 / transcript=Cvel_11557.t1 / gene=Cvel_11557 / organism=Chromera_velia_CCMP2878 / gene_product=Syntaxin-72, putative / transcript_product=Syntaxin-72, putative / location=Cvel_scaffold730:23524-26007(+) / protein_length=288 / sequence_SO=supercontig / SO=protein_coding / is_pseudo=false